MTTQKIMSTYSAQTLSLNNEKDQYTLGQILGIWLAAGAPMWLLGWVVYPWLSAGLAAVDAALLRLALLTGGLVWQFVLAMIILYLEEGNLRLSTIRRRFWLNHPVAASTGETQKRLWWWLIPMILLLVVLDIGLREPLVHLWTRLFPFLAEPAGYSGDALFAPELRPQWVGAWDLFGLLLVTATFNTFLGEELLFRGVLLPKMEGVFGKWDWVANGILFCFYHLHQPWGFLATLPGDLLFAYSAKRFRSNWFPIILHSGQSVYFLFLVLGLVLGLA
ncbi:MAG: CPBP family intramembrane glutamic endopeptidase [Caldilineaceae bacterium]